jgi:hypothetical protein
MKLFALLLFVSTLANAASYADPAAAKYDNLAVIQGSFNLDAAVVYRNATISSSTDPFAGKTNKYAEANAIMVTCTGQAAHIAFGTTAPTATTSDFLIPVNTPMVFAIGRKPYVALIQDAATAVCYTVELK